MFTECNGLGSFCHDEGRIVCVTVVRQVVYKVDGEAVAAAKSIPFVDVCGSLLFISKRPWCEHPEPILYHNCGEVHLLE